METDDKKREIDINDEKDRELNYSGNEGTAMPKPETDPDIIRNPDNEETQEKEESNDDRPMPGTL